MDSLQKRIVLKCLIYLIYETSKKSDPVQTSLPDLLVRWVQALLSWHWNLLLHLLFILAHKCDTTKARWFCKVRVWEFQSKSPCTENAQTFVKCAQYGHNFERLKHGRLSEEAMKSELETLLDRPEPNSRWNTWFGRKQVKKSKNRESKASHYSDSVL